MATTDRNGQKRRADHSLSSDDEDERHTREKNYWSAVQHVERPLDTTCTQWRTIFPLIAHHCDATTALNTLAVLPPVARAAIGARLVAEYPFLSVRPSVTVRRFVFDSMCVIPLNKELMRRDYEGTLEAAILFIVMARTYSFSVHIYHKPSAAELDAVRHLRTVMTFRMTHVRYSDACGSNEGGGGGLFQASWPLKRVELRDCHLDAVPADLVEHHSPVIIELTNNYLVELPSNASFYSCCISLNVSGNRLQSLPDALSTAGYLSSLNASSNELTPQSLVDTPRCMLEIDLSDNARITDIDSVVHWFVGSDRLMSVAIGPRRRCCCDEQTSPRALLQCRQNRHAADNN